MNSSHKSALWWMLALITFGVIAVCVGPKSLLILIPAAGFICYEAGPILRGDRN